MMAESDSKNGLSKRDQARIKLIQRGAGVILGLILSVGLILMLLLTMGGEFSSPGAAGGGINKLVIGGLGAATILAVLGVGVIVSLPLWAAYRRGKQAPEEGDDEDLFP